MRNIKEKKVAEKSRFMPVLSIFIILGLVVFSLFQYVKMNELTIEKNKINRQLLTAENEKAILSVKLEAKQSLKEIEDIAQNQLGLVKIEKYQMDYVTIETEDKVEIIQKEKENTVFNQIANAFSVLLEYLS